jgi:hypothetical protein
LGGIGLLGVGLAFAEEESDSVPAEGSILLCTDTIGEENTKLVYTYLDGERTACMPEMELRTVLGERAFDEDSSFQRAQSDEVMGFDILAAIQKGDRDFEGADLRRRDLMDVDLVGANLRGARLAMADLRGADLSGADLRGADLRGAFLMRTNLAGARLDGAELTRAFMMKADLTGARGITMDMVRTVKSLHEATMDEVLLDEIKSRCPKALEEPKDAWKPMDERPTIER